MHVIAHRVNTRAQLAKIDRRFGVEIDLRTRRDRLILQHDPFTDGEAFEEWLDDYAHGTLILNVKEAGLEAKILGVLAARGLDDFFFLDVTTPALVALSNAGETRVAGRVSEVEPASALRAIAGRVRWAWIDCFTRLPVEEIRALAGSNLKTCLVSPELVRGDLGEIEEFRNQIRAHGFRFDAVCTKAPERWQLVPDGVVRTGNHGQ